jgi:hypothetical protein
VQGIENVEGVFGNGALNKATFAIIKVYWDESQAGNPAHRQHAAAGCGLQDRILAECIQQDNKADATVTIVGMYDDASGY